MATFAELSANLKLDITDFAKNLDKASKKATKYASDLNGKINNGITEPTKKAGIAFKDVGRIVQGIVISQAFYRSINAITAATAATAQFSAELEQAQIRYTNLFNSPDTGTQFVEALQELSTLTNASFQQLEQSARTLTGYGVQAENLIYVLQGALSGASVTGDARTIQSFAQALGAAYDKGRLYNEDLRTLARTGLPVYEILSEKLGVTNEELRSLNTNALPASVAINALVEGLTERFGDLSDQIRYTVTSLLGIIGNNVKTLMAVVVQPLYDGFQRILEPIANLAIELRKVTEATGLGGLFERIFPPRLQVSLRQFIASLTFLKDIIAENLASILRFVGVALQGLIQALNVILPVLNIVLGVVAAINSWVTQTEVVMRGLSGAIAVATALWVAFKVKALAASVVTGVVTLISGALKGLSAVLTLLVAHPFWSLLLLLVGTVTALTGGFGKLGDAISGVFKNLTRIGGVNPDDILLPSQEDRTKDLNQFNNALDTTGDLMDDLASATGAATKAAKGLFSFDEVFKLKDPDETGGNAGWDIGDWDFGDIGAGLGEIALPDFDDLGIESWVDGFVQRLIEALGGKERIISVAIGAVLGAAITAALGGNPLIGAAIGGLAGALWDWIATELELSDGQKIGIPLVAGLSAAILGITGGKGGAVLGLAIGGVVSFLLSQLERGVDFGDYKPTAAALAGLISAAIGFVVKGPLGAAILGAIGALAGWIGGHLAQKIEEGESIAKEIGLGIGALIVGGIGYVVGGPAGAAIGAALGGLIGWLIGLLIENGDEIQTWLDEQLMKLGNFLYDIGETVFTTFGKITSSVGTFFKKLGTSFGNFFTTVGNAISNFFSNAWDKIKGFFTDTENESLGFQALITGNNEEFLGNLVENIATWFSDVWERFTKWLGDITTRFGSWASSTLGEVGTFFSDIWNRFTTWIGDITGKLGTAFSDWWTRTKAHFSLNLEEVKNFFSDVWTRFTGFVSDTTGKMSTFFSDLWTSVKDGTKNMLGTFTNWVNDLWNKVFNTLFGWINDLIGKFQELFSLNSQASNISVNTGNAGKTTKATGKSFQMPSVELPGHATGGIFNREHIAAFAEGNKAEAVIPLQNNEAMQPFSDAVARQVAQALGTSDTISSDPPIVLQVGTLVADQRGLRELQRRLQEIGIQEQYRRGISYGV